MQPKKYLFTQFIFILIICIFILPNTGVSQVVKVSAKDLALESNSILVGKCIKKESFWNESRTKIYTQVKIQTEENIKGNLGSEAVITIPGGRVGNTIYEVSDMPVFVEGEEVLVFLWRHPSGRNLVTGAQQGKLTVVEDRETGRKILRFSDSLLKQEEGLSKRVVQKKLTQTIFLDEFVNELKSYSKK